MREHLRRARHEGAEMGPEDEPSARLRTFASGGRMRARTLVAPVKSPCLTGRNSPKFLRVPLVGAHLDQQKLWSEKSPGLDIEGAIVAIATATLPLNCPCAASSHRCTALWDTDKPERTVQTCHSLLPHETVHCPHPLGTFLLLVFFKSFETMNWSFFFVILRSTLTPLATVCLRPRRRADRGTSDGGSMWY